MSPEAAEGPVLRPVSVLLRITDPGQPRDELTAVLGLLDTTDGFRCGSVEQSADAPAQWLLRAEWEQMGDQRKATSRPDVRMALMALAARAADQPTVYEVLEQRGALPTSRTSDRAHPTAGAPPVT